MDPRYCGSLPPYLREHAGRMMSRGSTGYSSAHPDLERPHFSRSCVNDVSVKIKGGSAKGERAARVR